MISPPNPSPTSRNSPTSPRRRHGLGGLPRRENLITNQLMKDLNSSNEYERGTYDLKKIVEYAKKKDYTSLIVVHTNRREPDTLLIIGLPNGPAAHFKLSNLVLRKHIKNHGNPTSHEQELVLNNFTTRLGNRVGRFFQSLFPQEPNFRGRRVVRSTTSVTLYFSDTIGKHSFTILF
ncbi:unnamed protein product [Brassica oleracea var. botrytis]